MKLDLIKMPLDDETALGASHILGCPDVPAKWNDDAVFFNDEVFVGQINLSEVKHPNLPSEGILYFFFASMSKPYRGIVRYAKSLEDLERIAPTGVEYHHDEIWHDGTGYAHVRASLVGSSVNIALVDGLLNLGTWQQVVLLDFDNKPRSRNITVQIIY